MRSLPLFLLGCIGPVADSPDPVERAWVSAAEAGPWGVGVATREAVRADGEVLTLEIWYPADVPDDAELEPYYEVVPGLGTMVREPPAAQDAPGELVVFSHGHGGVRFQSAFLTEHLASHGFIVVAPDHPGDTILDFDGDRTTEVAMWRPHDVSVALDWAVDGGVEGLGLPAPSLPAGMVGHSFGALTTLIVGGGRVDLDHFRATCAEQGGGVCGFVDPDAMVDSLVAERTIPDDRFAVTAALAPGGAYAFGPDGAGLAAVVRPLILAGALDGDLPWEREGRPVFDALGPPRALGLFPRAAHWAFTELCALAPFDDCAGEAGGFTEPAIVQATTSRLVTAHLGLHLRGDDRYADDLHGDAELTWEAYE